jgi:hypothetical protein
MGRRTIWCVFSSTNIPICVVSPTMVPTSVRGGRSGVGGTGGAGFATVATSGAGGCRDGENIGRSRVADKSASGTPHSGLPRGGAGLVRTGSAGASAGAPAKLAPTPADGPAAGSTAASTAAYVPIAASVSTNETVLRVRIADICEVLAPDERRSLKVPGRRERFDVMPKGLKVPKSQPGKHSATLATRLRNRTNRLGSVEVFAGR